MKARLRDQLLQFEPPILREKLGLSPTSGIARRIFGVLIASSAEAAWVRKAAGRSARTAPGQCLSKKYDDLSAIYCQFTLSHFMVRRTFFEAASSCTSWGDMRRMMPRLRAWSIGCRQLPVQPLKSTSSAGGSK